MQLAAGDGGGIDPAHASFLHRFLQDEDPSEGYGKQFRDKAGNTEIPMTKLLRDYPRPEIRVEDTEYGLRLISLRHMEDGRSHVRVTNQIFPGAICIPMSNEMTITQWHVPIDDENCYWYAMFTSFGKPVDKTVMWDQRIKEHRLPDFAPLKNRRNNYGFDPTEQKTLTYTGMGLDINVHDQWAVEGLGPIQDRTREHSARPTWRSSATAGCCARRWTRWSRARRPRCRCAMAAPSPAARSPSMPSATRGHGKASGPRPTPNVAPPLRGRPRSERDPRPGSAERGHIGLLRQLPVKSARACTTSSTTG